MSSPTILLLDLNPANNLCEELHAILGASFDVIVQRLPIGPEELPGKQDLSTAVTGEKFDLIFAILAQHTRLDSLFRTLRETVEEVPFIAVVDEVNPAEILDLLKSGAADYITSPLKALDILPRAWRLLERARHPQRTLHVLKEKLGLKQLVGQSPVFVAELDKIPLVAKCDAIILISGETGTGKELFARAIHHLSPRAGKPFIPANCGAIPPELVENELFGHKRGAFTGADTSECGVLEEAEGGTIFLDEIDCLPLLAQSKLLRFLQEKEYRPLGSARMRKADVRVIAASNVNFEEAVASGKLRKDLYYRLNVIRLSLPALRNRREDIPFLVQHFLAKYANEFDKDVPKIPDTIMQMLITYDWPGNIRELEHVIERAVVLSEGGSLSAKNVDLPGLTTAPEVETFQIAKASVIEQFERAYIQRLLVTYRGNITHAAHAAHKNRRAFWQLIRKHHIEVESFKSCTS